MRPAVTTVEQGDHVAAAAYLMKHAGAAALMVVDPQTSQPRGIITEADIARVVADGKNVNDVRVHDLMTENRRDQGDDQHPERGPDNNQRAFPALAGGGRRRADRHGQHQRRVRRAARPGRLGACGSAAGHDSQVAGGEAPGWATDGRVVRRVRPDPASPVNTTRWPATVPAVEQLLCEGLDLAPPG